MTNNPAQVKAQRIADAQFARESTITALSMLAAGRANIVAEVTAAEMTGDDKIIYDRLKEWIYGDNCTECQHSPMSTGQPSYWFPADPAFMCLRCAMFYEAAISGTPEDFTCDICHTAYPPGTDMHQKSMTLKGGGTEDGNVVGVINTRWATCHSCYDELHPEKADA